MSPPSRRDFVKLAAAAAGAVLVPPALQERAHDRMLDGAASPDAEEHGWERVPSILARIKPPTFPARAFPVTRYGAKSDGVTDSSAAFRRAIAACAAAGGGRVVVDGGTFLTGPIHLRSRVNLEVKEGATITFLTDPKAYEQYVLTRFEGVEMMGLSPLIYASNARDVAITGAGTLDGQAGNDVWWHWNGSARYGWKQGAGNQLLACRTSHSATRAASVDALASRVTWRSVSRVIKRVRRAVSLGFHRPDGSVRPAPRTTRGAAAALEARDFTARCGGRAGTGNTAKCR